MPGGWVWPSALIALLVLAGCTAAPNAAPATTEAAPAPPAEFDAETGAIQGSVLDEELRPISGAQVALVGSDQIEVTDPQGGFTFSRVLPGKAQLAAAALGYDSVVRSVDVLAGEVTHVQLLLAPVAVVEARIVSFIFNGYWNCQIHTGVGILQCGVQGLTPAGLRNSFNYPVEAGVAMILQEMTWKPSSAYTQPSKSQLFFGSQNANEKFALHGYYTAPPPIALRIVPGEDFPKTGWTEFTAGQGKTAPTDIVRGNIQARPVAYFEVGEAGTGLIYEQKFVFYVSVAYVEPLKAEYTGIPDG